MVDFNEILEGSERKVLMVVFPHPDDETMATAGLLVKAIEKGWKTIVVTLTKGGMGRIFIHGAGRNVKEIRSEELEKAVKILKVNKLILADFNDGSLRDEEKKWSDWLLKVLNEEKPSVVISYDHSGVTGHPDHISLSVGLKKIMKGLSWKPDLFWVAFPEKIKVKIVNKALLNIMPSPTHELDFGNNWFAKWRAAKAHKSQALGRGMGKIKIPLIFLLAKYHYEWYYKVDLSQDYVYKFVNFKL